MKNLFNRTLSILCAVTLLICAVSACAFADEEEYATPTDLAETEEKTSPEEASVQPETQLEAVEEAQEENEPEAEREEENKTEEEIEPGDVNEEPQEADPEESEGAIESVEIVITKIMAINDSWDGFVRDSRLAVLKLDLDKAQTVHMILEGNHVTASIRKSDREEVTLRTVVTDSETKQAIISWEAERGSYLVIISPDTPYEMAKAAVIFMNDETYIAWEEEQLPEVDEMVEEQRDDILEEKIIDSESLHEEEDIEDIPEKSDNQPENEEYDGEEDIKETISSDINDDGIIQEENEGIREEITEEQTERYVEVSVTYDSPYPVLGDIAHFDATLFGYEEINYSIQWQYSIDHQEWNDIPNASETRLDMKITSENNHYYWRIIIFVEEDNIE